MHDGAPRPFYRQLHWQILAAMVLGAVLGAGVGEPAARALGWMGTVFVRLLTMVIVPLIFTSIVAGVTSVGKGTSLGRLGLRTLVYYVTTSFLAILTGLFLVNLIGPGRGADLGQAATATVPEVETPANLAEVFLRMIPKNPVQALANGDMLAIIFFAIVVGVALTHLPAERFQRLRGLFDDLFELMMKVTGGVILLAPLGVLGLITRTASTAGIASFGPLARYAGTILAGLGIHILITLPLLLVIFGRMSPVVHYRNMWDALLMAFSTSSSSATLPVTLRCAEENVGVSNRIASFVLPMGATVNMDGTALYECVGVIFISQVLGIGLDITAQITVVVTALLASIGAAGIPSAGLVMIFVVTRSVGLTGPEVGLIVGAMLAIDRPLDMLRTVTNVLSDSCGTAIIAVHEGETEINQS
jgi:Na+/H+-dicarboxylate symporter